MKVLEYLPPLSLSVIAIVISILTDISDIISPLIGLPVNITKVLLIIFIIFISFCYMGIGKIYRNSVVKYVGFDDVKQEWFNTSDEKAIAENKKSMTRIFNNSITKEIFIASISGEWDLIKPFSITELQNIFSQSTNKMKILLIHPESEALIKLVENEPGNLLEDMKSKIVRNTELLINTSKGKCEVRWYMGDPLFHIIASDVDMNVGIYPKGKKGHKSKRYILKSQNDLYNTFNNLFSTLWDNALEAWIEIRRVRKNIEQNKAVFLDLDGTLIEDQGYSSNLQIKILDGVVDSLSIIRNKGYRLIIITNQQAIGLGLVQNDVFLDKIKIFKDEFKKCGIIFDQIFYCPHSESDDCQCRKPKPGLFLTAIQKYNLEKSKCYFITDSESDAEIKYRIPEMKTFVINSNNSFWDYAKRL